MTDRQLVDEWLEEMEAAGFSYEEIVGLLLAPENE